MSIKFVEPQQNDGQEIDEIAQFVKREQITATCARVDVRPDVSTEEQVLWQKQDPDYPLEHYRCLITRQSKSIEVYQTVGADYPDEDDEDNNIDLYRDNRELLLSPEFLLETTALKANSIDEASNLSDWVANGYCTTITPEEAYRHYLQIRQGLLDLLGAERYKALVQLALESELDDEEESEEIE
jgi:hypothetical protein